GSVHRPVAFRGVLPAHIPAPAAGRRGRGGSGRVRGVRPGPGPGPVARHGRGDLRVPHRPGADPAGARQPPPARRRRPPRRRRFPRRVRVDAGAGEPGALVPGTGRVGPGRGAPGTGPGHCRAHGAAARSDPLTVLVADSATVEKRRIRTGVSRPRRRDGGSEADVATVSQWVAGARPRTLPNSVVPVAVGTGLAFGLGAAVWWKALLALVVA